MLRFLIVLLLHTVVTKAYKSYSGYKIVRVKVGSAADYNDIAYLEAEELLEILSGPPGHLDVLVESHNVAKTLHYFRAGGQSYEVVTEDVGVEVEKEHRRLLLKGTLAKGDFTYDSYHRIGVINARLDALADKHKDISETFNLPGETYEKRKIQAIRITADVSSEGSKEKPMIWLDGGIHAREWVVPATMMYIIDSLLGEEEQEHADQIKKYLDKYQIVVAPCINPDGYEYSHEKERLWRKNRSPAGCKNNKQNWFGGCFSTMCYGIDLNRNWDTVHFGTIGISKNPCSLVYPGEKPFDQDATRIVKDYLIPHKDKIKLFVTYHSYSQLFLTPYGYTVDELPPDHEHHTKVGNAVVDAIKQRHNASYIVMRGAELYPVSGDSFDWAYMKLNVTDSYCFELRPDGWSWRIGFELPEEQILPTAQENVDGLMALIKNTKFEMEGEEEKKPKPDEK